jgi:exosortase
MTLSCRNALFTVFSLMLALVSYELISRLMTLSLGFSENQDLSHILLIPIVSAVLIYSNKENIFRDPRASILPAATVFAASAVLAALGWAYGVQLAETDYLAFMTAALVAAWFGGFLLIYGSLAFKAALFPLFFLALAIPIPHQLLNGLMRFLQKGSADLVAVLFTLTGTPFYRNDMVFTMPSVAIEVAQACSGIRSTLGMFIVTLVAAHLLLRSNWRRAALLVAVVPISLFKNAVRIVTLTFLAVHYDMSFLTGDLHREGGILFMLGGLCLMYPILSFLLRSEIKNLDSGVRP